MAKVNRYKDNSGSTTSVWNDSGDKRYGFVSKDKDYEDPSRTRYGIGIDNMGSPYRGTSDNQINTPIGRVDYGYEGDTIYGGYTPTALKRMDMDYPTNQYHSVYLDNVAGMYPGVYTQTTPMRGTEYGVEIEGFPVNGNGWKEYNTPFGTLRGGISDDQVAGASFAPNAQTNYYLQALAKLLGR